MITFSLEWKRKNEKFLVKVHDKIAHFRFIVLYNYKFLLIVSISTLEMMNICVCLE